MGRSVIFLLYHKSERSEECQRLLYWDFGWCCWSSSLCDITKQNSLKDMLCTVFAVVFWIKHVLVSKKTTFLKINLDPFKDPTSLIKVKNQFQLQQLNKLNVSEGISK